MQIYDIFFHFMTSECAIRHPGNAHMFIKIQRFTQNIFYTPTKFYLLGYESL